MTYTAAQFVTNLAGIGIDVAQNLLCLFRREDAQIAAGNAQVGADAHRAHTDQDAVCSLGLLLKDVTQFLLDESGYFRCLVVSIKLKIKEEVHRNECGAFRLFNGFV